MLVQFHKIFLFLSKLEIPVLLSIGIAFRGLKSIEIYPVVSSTAARSAIRLVCSVSAKETLQMLCLQVISSHSQLRKEFRDMPVLARIYDQRYFWINTNCEFFTNKMVVRRGVIKK